MKVLHKCTDKVRSEMVLVLYPGPEDLREPRIIPDVKKMWVCTTCDSVSAWPNWRRGLMSRVSSNGN